MTLLQEETLQQLNNSINDFQRIFGGKSMGINYLSTGNETLDSMLSGGYKKGTLVELSGITDSGKTLLALKAVKQAQISGKIAVYINPSYSLNDSMILDNSIDEDNLLVINMNKADKLGPILSALQPHIEDIGIIVIDDLANLTTENEQSSSIRKNTEIHRSKVIKALLTRLANLVRNTEACVLIVNQERINFIDNQASGTVSSSEKWVELTCDTRIKLDIAEDGDSCVDIKFKKRKL